MTQHTIISKAAFFLMAEISLFVLGYTLLEKGPERFDSHPNSFGCCAKHAGPPIVCCGRAPGGLTLSGMTVHHPLLALPRALVTNDLLFSDE